jgi:hypothetical protein
MNSPAGGLGYYLWLRIRWGAAGTLAYLICLGIAAHVVPKFGEPDPIILALCALTASITHLLQVFTLGPADFGVKTSGFPTYMFALPVKTRTLSGWPIVYAAASFAMLWVLIVFVVLVPAGYSPPILWPAAIGATAVGWIQAVSWSPFPTPFARVPAIAIAMAPLILCGTWTAIYPNSLLVLLGVIALCSLWLVVAYAVAIRGIARARCGTESNWTFLMPQLSALIELWWSTNPFGWRGFSSPTMAQFWHECRRNVLVSPAMAVFIGLPLLALNCHTVLNPSSDRTLLFGGLPISPAAMCLVIWIAVPLLLATTLGQGMGKFDVWGKDTMPSFFAIRPMTTVRFVALKLVAAAVSVIAGWAIVGLLNAVWALIEISPLNANESLVRAAWENLTLRGATVAVLAAAAVVAITWRLVVIGMWPSLSGRKGVPITISIASLAWLGLAGFFASWVYKHPEVHPRLLGLTTTVVGVLLAAKFAVSAWAICRLHQLQLITVRATTKLLAAWFAVFIAILAGLSQLVSPNWLMVGCVALMLPVARIAFAPLALHWNRHR